MCSRRARRDDGAAGAATVERCGSAVENGQHREVARLAMYCQIALDNVVGMTSCGVNCSRASRSSASRNGADMASTFASSRSAEEVAPAWKIRRGQGGRAGPRRHRQAPVLDGIAKGGRERRFAQTGVRLGISWFASLLNRALLFPAQSEAYAQA